MMIESAMTISACRSPISTWIKSLDTLRPDNPRQSVLAFPPRLRDTLGVISDAAGDAQPAKLKRIMRPLTELQWKQARIMFETAGLDTTQAHIAVAFNTSLSSVQKRSAAEKWSKGAQFVADARKHLATAADAAMSVAADKAAQQMATKITKELQPWIEKEKRAHIKRAIKRAKAGFKRLDRVADGYEVYDSKAGRLVACETNPKDEMNIAAAEDKWDGIVRRTLGLSDSAGSLGGFSLRVLTGAVAVEVQAGQVDPK